MDKKISGLEKAQLSHIKKQKKLNEIIKNIDIRYEHEDQRKGTAGKKPE